MGADVIANKEYTDFALLKLRQAPRDLTNFIPYYLGWDKSGNTGTGSIGIHHPKGDVKKISVASSSAINDPHILDWSDGTYSNPNTHWKVHFTKGFMEGGSSGSPLLNNERRVIGQLHGGGEGACDNVHKYYGKFNLSWIGNGATDNRRKLQPWLDPLGTNQNTIEGRYPFAILGDDTICSQGNHTYTLQNASIYYEMTWQTSSNLQIISSTNSSVTVKKISSGSGYIKAVYGDVEIRKEVFVGKVLPMNYKLFDISTNEPVYYLCSSQPKTVKATIIEENPNISEWEWDTTGAYIDYLSSNKSKATIHVTNSSNFSIKLRAKSECGWNEWGDLGLSVIPCGNFFSIYPNPASGTVTIQLEETEESSIGKLALNNAYRIDIYNMSGYMVRSVTAKENEVQILLQGLLPGIYAVHLVKDGKVYKKKLVVE